MYKKIDGHLKAIKGIQLTSDSTFILIHKETERGTEEVYKCPSESRPLPVRLRVTENLLAIIHIP